MPPSDALTTIVIVIALGLTAWFFIGINLNVRRGDRTLRWLQEGLPLVGEKTTMRWMGSTGVHLGISSPKEPFKNVEFLFLMQPRDVVPLWMLTYAQGRRDFLIVRAHLQRHARVEFDLLDPNTWNGKQALAHTTPPTWSRLSLPNNLLLASEGPDAEAVAKSLLPMITRLPLHVCRFSVRRTVPHVEVHMVVKGGKDEPKASIVLRTLIEIGRTLLPA